MISVLTIGMVMSVQSSNNQKMLRFSNDPRRTFKLSEVPAIIAVGLNYPDHAHQVANATPTSPIIFMKNRNSLTVHEDEVIVPPCSASPDYEAELGVIIKDTFRDSTEEDALKHVLGYTVVNDISGRCWQKTWGQAYNISTHTKDDFDVCVGDGGQWPFSKSFDTHLPIGPVVVPQELLHDASGLGIQLHLNGKLMQNDTTSNMIFDVRQVISFISRGQTIEAGTIIAMGTMGGIGDTQTPRVVLKDNDIVTVTIEKIGSLINKIRRETAAKMMTRESTTFKEMERSSDNNDTKATRVVRFLDRNGKIQYGEPEEDINGHVVRAKLIESNNIYGSRAFTGETLEVVKILTPIDPVATLGIGLNYVKHSTESNMTVPLAPIVFFKNRKSITTAFGDVRINSHVVLPDYEGELAVIFGKDCKDRTRENALECVLGYSVANDVTARCWQSNLYTNITNGTSKCLGNGGQWTYSKSSIDMPLGRDLVFKDSLSSPDASGLTVQTHLNSNLMQNETTDDMIFGIRELVEFVTKGTTIEQGTVLITGTPSGVGIARSPPVILKHGDIMRVTIDSIGTIENRVTYAQ